MADPKGFLKVRERELPERRPVDVRIMDWKEVYEEQDREQLQRQAGRCMDCGIPFCHSGCPLGNLIPEWNNLAWKGDFREGIERLHATNNFPEFTGRLCPAPCETACVLGINQPAVTIKQIEVETIETAFDSGWVTPLPPERLTGKTVAVVGSGPAGLAAAQQLTRAGHTVVVYEKDDKPGGLMRYGIPEFKMEKSVLDRRIDQMKAEGTRFRSGVEIGKDVTARQLRDRFDAVVIATGAMVRRDLPVPGREVSGIYQAMDYLPQANRVALGEEVEDQILATGKDVIVIGGGDTGADCIGTAHRQGARSVTSLEILPQPGEDRPKNQPWPTYPTIFRVASAHEEGGERLYAISTKEALADDEGNHVFAATGEQHLANVEAARAAGLLAIVGVVLLPVIRYSVVWWNSLHQGQTIKVFGQSSMDPSMQMPLWAMVIGTHVWFVGSLLARARADNLRREAGKDWVARGSAA